MHVEGGRQRVPDLAQQRVDLLERLLGDRQQDRDVRLGVEEHELLQPPVALPAEPAGVGPVEVVQVADLVDVRARVAPQQSGDGLLLGELDDGHRAQSLLSSYRQVGPVRALG